MFTTLITLSILHADYRAVAMTTTESTAESKGYNVATWLNGKEVAAFDDLAKAINKSWRSQAYLQMEKALKALKTEPEQDAKSVTSDALVPLTTDIRKYGVELISHLQPISVSHLVEVMRRVRETEMKEQHDMSMGMKFKSRISLQNSLAFMLNSMSAEQADATTAGVLVGLAGLAIAVAAAAGPGLVERFFPEMMSGHHQHSAPGAATGAGDIPEVAQGTAGVQVPSERRAALLTASVWVGFGVIFHVGAGMASAALVGGSAAWGALGGAGAGCPVIGHAVGEVVAHREHGLCVAIGMRVLEGVGSAIFGGAATALATGAAGEDL